jgi:hypothetical protein
MPDATPVYDPVSRYAPLALLILLLSACASAPVPSMELSRAREALEQARADGAADYAPVDYRLAREALDGGRTLIESHDNEDARQRLQLAQARAELASAKSQGARLRAEVADKELANSRLRRELLGEGQVP